MEGGGGGGLVFKGDARTLAIRPVVVSWWRIRSWPRELLLYTGSLGGRQSIERERDRERGREKNWVGEDECLYLCCHEGTPGGLVGGSARSQSSVSDAQ